MFFPEKAPAEHGGDQSHQLPSQDSDGGQRGQEDAQQDHSSDSSDSQHDQQLQSPEECQLQF